MGKKATSKLLRKVKGTVTNKARNAVGGNKRTGDSLSTKLNRQQKRMKAGRRAGKEGEEEDEEEKAERAKKSKSKNWAVDAARADDTETGFDVDTASRKKKKSTSAAVSSAAVQAKAIIAKASEMDVDSFLEGGHEALGGLSDDDDEAEDSQDEDGAELSDAEGEEGEGETGNTTGDSDEDEEEDSEDEYDEATHKRDLEALAKQDPEFYKHLKQEGSELLNFGDDESSEEEEEQNEQSGDKDNDGEDSDDDDDKMQTSAEDDGGAPVLSRRQLQRMLKGAFVGKADRALRDVVAAFRAGCHVADPKDVASKQPLRYRIASSSVYQKLMVTSLQKLHPLLHAKLGSSADGGLSSVTGSKRWKRYQSTIKSIVSNLVHLLGQSNDPSMLRFLLQSSRHYAVFVMAFGKPVLKKFVKVVIELWANTEDSGVRVLAFLRIRQALSLMLDSGLDEMFEQSLRTCYLSFVKGAKFSTETTSDRISVQARCLVELFGLDLSIAYQLGFVYIRQLALHLRTAIASKTVQATRNVCSWQYVHCLRLWGSVLSAYTGSAADQKQAAGGKGGKEGNTGLKPLVYPLVQVVIGVVRLAPTARSAPLRLHCVSILTSISRATDTFIPGAPLLLELLQPSSQLFHKKPVASTAKPPDLEHAIRLGKDVVRQAPCQDALFSRVLAVLRTHLESFRFSMGFPELATSVQAALRSFCKRCTIGRWRAQAKALLEVVGKWVDFVRTKRTGVSFAPANVSSMTALLADQAAEARRRAVADAQRLDVATAVKAAQLPAGDSDDDDDDDDDGDVAMSDGEDNSENNGAKQTKKNKKNKKKKAKKVVVEQAMEEDGDDDSGDDGEGEDDVVGELEMSDDSESDNEEE